MLGGTASRPTPADRQPDASPALNDAVAVKLDEIGALLQDHGANPFRIRADRPGADAVRRRGPAAEDRTSAIQSGRPPVAAHPAHDARRSSLHRARLQDKRAHRLGTAHDWAVIMAIAGRRALDGRNGQGRPVARPSPGARPGGRSPPLLRAAPTRGSSPDEPAADARPRPCDGVGGACSPGAGAARRRSSRVRPPSRISAPPPTRPA